MWISQPAGRMRLLFYSSRRRHTRFSRDWSSDVCSSDLPEFQESKYYPVYLEQIATAKARTPHPSYSQIEIGRASCRERGAIDVNQGIFKRNKDSPGITPANLPWALSGAAARAVELAAFA